MNTRFFGKSGFILALLGSSILLSTHQPASACLRMKTWEPQPQSSIPAWIGWVAIAAIGGAIVANEAAQS